LSSSSEKRQSRETDNGVWLATTEDHHRSLRRDFPTMRSIKVLGKNALGKKSNGLAGASPPTLRILRKRPCVPANSFLRKILESGRCRERGDRRRRRKPRKAADRRRILDCHPGRFLDCHPDPERSRRGGIGSLIPSRDYERKMREVSAGNSTSVMPALPRSRSSSLPRKA